MLTLKKISVAVGDLAGAMEAARYPLELADSPQAFERDGDGDLPALANSVWIGTDSALGQLGLERGSEVTAEQLALALQGLHTETGKEVRRPGFKKVPVLEDGKPVLDEKGKPLQTTVAVVNSVDLTFSAPKSVSVVWSMAGSELRREIEQAMLDAANATVEYMTLTKPVVQTKGDKDKAKKGGKGRKGEKGKRGEKAGKSAEDLGEPAIGFAASASLHVTARTAQGDVAPAPQLHVHVDLVGVESKDGGKLRTPGTAALFKFDAPLAGGALGRAVLADRMRKLGFGIEWGTGRDGRYFEIAGVEEGLIERMSPRAQEVERERVRRELEKGERLTGEALAKIALETRGTKANPAPEVTAERWKSQHQEFNYREGAAEERLARWHGPECSTEMRLTEARESILELIAKRGPTVSRNEAEAIAYAVAPIGLSLDEITGLLGAMERGGELIALGGDRVTTHPIRSREEAVMRVASEAASGPGKALSKRARARGEEAANRALGKGKSLDPEQRRAFKALTSGKGWATLTGLAGTGKGPVLQAVAEAHRSDGWQVVACAVDGSTAQRLGHQIESPALTIEQVMRRTELGSVEVGEQTLILIEEASKVGLSDWVRLAKLVKEKGARLVAVGHTGQLGAIELPGLFAEMIKAKAIPTLKLKTIRRQRHQWMRDYQVALDKGRPDEPRHAATALKLLQDHDAIRLLDTRLEAMGTMVEDWDQHRRRYNDPRETIMVVHGSNNDVDLVNELAQKARLDTHVELSGDGIKAPDRSYKLYAGDVVMVRESAYEFEPDGAGMKQRRVENGTIGIVDRVDLDAKQVWVRLSEPGVEERTVPIDLARLSQRGNGSERVAALRLAYAFHPFPLQGATVEAVFVLEGDRNARKEAIYVADTRAREFLRKYVDRESLGTELTDAERWGQYLKRMLQTQSRSSSIAFGEIEEPLRERLSEFTLGPKRPARSAELELGEDLEGEVPSEASDRTTYIDPLEAHRAVLGEERTEALEDRARFLGRYLGGRDETWLRQSRRELREPFEQLDRRGAREALVLEREKRMTMSRIHEARRQADELEQTAGKLKGRRHRRVRDELLEEAQTRREVADQDYVRLTKTAGKNEKLRETGRHPDGWVADHGEAAARVAALERELAAREQAREAAQPATPDPAREPELVAEPPGPGVEL